MKSAVNHRFRTGHLLGRFILWAVLINAVWVAEQWLLDVYLPGPAARLGVAQFPASDAASHALRSFEWARSSADLLVIGVVVLSAWAIWVAPLTRSLICTGDEPAAVTTKH